MVITAVFHKSVPKPHQISIFSFYTLFLIWFAAHRFPRDVQHSMYYPHPVVSILEILLFMSISDDFI